MTNGRELSIYTLWGKKSIETQPLRNYKYQFSYQNWLFINETFAIDLDYALNSGRPLNEKTLMWNYDVIPFETLEKSALDYVSEHCFNLNYNCIIDQGKDLFHPQKSPYLSPKISVTLLKDMGVFYIRGDHCVLKRECQTRKFRKTNRDGKNQAIDLLRNSLVWHSSFKFLALSVKGPLQNVEKIVSLVCH